MKFPSPIMDVHTHFTTPKYLDFLDKHDASLEDGFPLPQWHEQEHLDFMDTCGISWTLLSLSTPQPYFDNSKNESIALCRSLNEEAALFRQRHPTRIGFMACLPLPCVDAAIEEAIYAIDILGANGIKLASNSRGLYLGAPELEPLMAELNKRQAICTIHPHRPEPLKEGIFSAGPVPLFEFLADTTRSVLNLISNGVILRYPNITWIVPHCGSFLPNIYDRYIGISHILIPQGLMQDVDVKSSLGQLYFDLSGNPAPHLLDWLLSITTPDHVLYGSDYPFTPLNQIQHNQEALFTMLNSTGLQPYGNMILSANAQKLFHI